MDHTTEPLRAWLATKRGRQVALAAYVKVRPSVVAAWVSMRRPIPIERCVAIERATAGAVTRQDLRPDDWRDIWPELADSEPKQATALASKAQAAINPVANEAAHV